MKSQNSEWLLSTVLDWTSKQLAEERPVIDAFARIKYDEYQQFKPGMKFIESLALWLYQFTELPERRAAYDYIRKQLIFISASEMNHMVDITYSSVIRPILIQLAAENTKIPYWQTARIADSQYFKELKRRCLFLGLSDGARVDRFRRTNKELSNEQFHASYELSEKKVRSFVSKLKKELAQLRNVSQSEISDEEATFKIIFLLDDFSASGLSLLRFKDGKYDGKLEKIRASLYDAGAPLANAIDPDGCDVFPIMYVITEKANNHLKLLMPSFWKGLSSKCVVTSTMKLEENITLGQSGDDAMKLIVDKYYDEDVFDENLAIGNTEDVKLGFAGCGIPVVLNHNTPNDSLFLLWSYSKKTRGLFPRVTRHKEA